MADEEGLEEIYAVADAEASASLDVLSGADKIAGLFGDDDLTENQESDSEDSEDQDDDETDDDSDSGDSDSDDDEASDEDSEDELDADDEEDDEDSGETSDDADEALTHLDLSEDVLDSLVPVKVNGEVKEVSLRESLAGYQRQQAFTAKTQALAEQRKALEVEIAGKQAERQEYVQGLERIKIAMTVEEPDWDKIKAERPDDYPDEFRAFQTHKAQIAEVEAEQEKVLLEATTEAEAARKVRFKEEQEALKLAIPEWDDDEVFEREGGELFRYLNDAMGYTVEDFNAIEDHRVLLLLRKAMKYDKLTQKGKEIREKAKKAKKTPNLTPGGSESVSEKKGEKKDRASKAARSRFSKSGHVRDAAVVMEDFIE